MKQSYYTLILLVIMFSTGCEKILDKDPVDQISVEGTFADIDGAKAALLGAYGSLFGTAYYNGERTIYPELTGGNVRHSKTSAIDLLEEYSFSSVAAESGMAGTYSAMYAILNNLNYIIQKVPAIAEAGISERNRLVGEASALRALVHFDLLQLYAQAYTYTADASHLGIMLNLEPILLNGRPIKRSTVKEGYAAVLQDLQSAATLIANSNPIFTSGHNSNYINENNIDALMARVYLSMGDWQQAYAASDKVINQNTYTLFTNANYVSSWSLMNTTESIFEVSVPTGFAGNSYGSYFTLTSTYLQMATTADLLNLYRQTDVRGKNSMFNSQARNGVTYYYTKKYATETSSATGFKVIRLSEMYLIRAEAAAELGNFPGANADLNRIRKRADLNAETLALNSSSALVDSIMLERRRELSFEGFLLFDIARRKGNIVRKDCESTRCNLIYPNSHFVLPIPEQSVRANSNMVQNPDY